MEERKVYRCKKVEATEYIAPDGTTFDTKEECAAYEQRRIDAFAIYRTLVSFCNRPPEMRYDFNIDNADYQRSFVITSREELEALATVYHVKRIEEIQNIELPDSIHVYTYDGEGYLIPQRSVVKLYATFLRDCGMEVK